VKEASDEVGIYTTEKVVPQNIGIATEIVSVSVAVVRPPVTLVREDL